MRALTMNEVGLVHGADGIWETISGWWDAIFDTAEEINDYKVAFDHLYNAVVNGDTSPENACASLGALLELVPKQDIDPYKANLVAEFCANSANVIQDAIKLREQQMEDAGASNYNPEDYQVEEYWADSGWLDDVYSGWNDYVVDSFWDSYNDYAYVEIEIIDYC
jgi:hypothetical protein